MNWLWLIGALCVVPAIGIVYCCVVIASEYFRGR
jgi:hypothetical protein